MAKVPGFAKAFVGRWRIVEMDNWDSDFLDLVEEAVALHSDYNGASGGQVSSGRCFGRQPVWTLANCLQFT